MTVTRSEIGIGRNKPDQFILALVEVPSSGEATVRSASGDVVINEAESSVTVQTASGDQHVGSVASGRVTLQSASGDQHVGSGS